MQWSISFVKWIWFNWISTVCHWMKANRIDDQQIGSLNHLVQRAGFHHISTLSAGWLIHHWTTFNCMKWNWSNFNTVRQRLTRWLTGQLNDLEPQMMPLVSWPWWHIVWNAFDQMATLWNRVTASMPGDRPIGRMCPASWGSHWCHNVEQSTLAFPPAWHQ